jgi:hypothetical protein
MRTIIALVVKNDSEKPDRQIMQRMGDMIAAVAEGDKNNILFVIAANSARGTMWDIMTGFGSTAEFTCDQIKTLSGQHLPNPEPFVRLIKLIHENEAIEKPRPVVAVIAETEFIKAFLRFFFSSIAKTPLATSLNDFVSYGTTVAVETGTHTIKILQPSGSP